MKNPKNFFQKTIITLFAAFTLALVSLANAQEATPEKSEEQSYVEGLISDLISTDGQTINFDGLSVSLGGDVSAKSMTIADTEGTWLTIKELTLDWQPLSLISGPITVNEISAAKVILARPPEPTQPKEEETSTELKAFTVDKINFADIELQKPVLGAPVRLSAGGTAQVTADPNTIKIDLNAQRIDDKVANLIAKVDFTPSNENLTVDITLREERGGIITTLLPIDENPNLDLSIKGSGTLANWQGKLALLFNDRSILSGTANIRDQENNRTISANLSGTAYELMPVSARPLFPNLTNLSTEVSLSPKSEIILRTFALTGEIAKSTARGFINTEKQTADLQFKTTLSLANDDRLILGDASAPLSLGSGSINATASGPFSKLQWEVDADLDHMQTAGYTIKKATFAGRGIPSQQNGAIAADGTLSGEVIPPINSAFPKALSGQLQAYVTGTYSEENPLTLTRALIKSDTMSLTADGSLVPTESRMNLKLTGTASNLGDGIPNVDTLLKGETSINGNINGALAEAITLSDITLENAGLTTSLSGTISEKALDLKLDTNLPDVNRLYPELAGALALNGTLKGDTAAPTANLIIESNLLTVSGKQVEDLNGTLQAKLHDTLPTADINVTGIYLEKPLALNATLTSRENGTKSIALDRAKIADATLTGAIDLSENNQPSGTIIFDIPKLSDLSRLALQNAKGIIKGQLTLTPNGAATDAKLNATARLLSIDSIKAGTAAADITVLDLLARPTLAGTLSATKLKVADLDFGTLDAIAEATQNGFSLSTNNKGKDASGNASIAVDYLPGSATTLSLNTLDYILKTVPLSLKQPTTITVDKNTTTLADTLLNIGSGTTTIKGTLAPRYALTTDFNAVPLSLANAFVQDQNISGNLSGKATINQGTSTIPQIEANATISNLATTATRANGLPAITIKAKAQTQQDALNFTANATDANGSGSIDTTLQGTVGLTGAMPLSLSANGKINLTLLADTLAASGLRIAGGTTLDLTIKGTASNPVPSGTIKIANTTVGDLEGKLNLTNLNGTVALNNNTATIQNLNGKAGKQGTIAINGTIGTTAPLPANITVVIDNGDYTDDTLVLSTFDANITVGGALIETPSVTGSVDLVKTLITLNEIPQFAINIENVVHLAPPLPVAKQARSLAKRTQQSQGSGGAILDIAIKTIEPIFIRGRGIKADFSGGLTVAGTTSNPQAVGNFLLRRGSIDIIGRTLNLKEDGTLAFNGSLVPNINIEASGTSKGTLVTIALIGPADKPDIIISSSPQIPDEEALALLLFERRISDLSPFQIASLADALISLSGGRQTSTLESLRQGLGIDRLDIGTDEDNNTTLGVGKYINERTYFGVNRNIQTGEIQATINLDVTKELKLQGSASDQSGASLGIIFEREY